MNVLAVIALAGLLGGPIALAIAWWLWLRYRDARNSSWRATTLLAGLLCATLNLAIFFVGVPIAHLVIWGDTPQWKIFDVSGNIGIFLLCTALVAALIGEGKARIPLALCSLLGIFLWLPVGVL